MTRSDFDGLVCALLLTERGLIDDLTFVHPKDMQDGKIAVGPGDITTNLPYVEGVHLAFDHHLSEAIRNRTRRPNHIIDPEAPSASRMIYEHFGGRQAFPNLQYAMLIAVDKADAAMFSNEEILHPQGWDLLNFLTDPRTSLGRFKDFRISNYQLMRQLISYCRTHPIEEILALPDVAERIALYRSHEEPFRQQIERCAHVYRNLVLLDLRKEETIYVGNRYILQALHPQCDISLHAFWGLKRQNTVFAVNRSIFKRTSKVNVGELMLSYGGGGHLNAGTCQVANEVADLVLAELITRIHRSSGTTGRLTLPE